MGTDLVLPHPTKAGAGKQIRGTPQLSNLVEILLLRLRVAYGVPKEPARV